MRTVILLTCVAVLAAAAPAAADITASQITSPAGYTQRFVESPGTLQVSGTVTGTGNVDLLCYEAGTSQVRVAGPITPTAGAFTATVKVQDFADRPCILRAVTAGKAPAAPPGSASPFAGPEMAISTAIRERVLDGGNAGKVYETYVEHVLGSSSGELYDAGGCGLSVSELFTRPTFAHTEEPWGCAGYLWYEHKEPGSTVATGAQLVVDGQNAYLTNHILGGRIYPDSHLIPGLPAQSTTASVTLESGVRMNEINPVVRCSTNTYPATPVTCPTAVATGIELRRTARWSPDSREVEFVDELRSVDGKAHEVELFYENNLNGRPEYRLPGETRFTQRTRDFVTSIEPGAPGTLFVRARGAEDPAKLDGAITWAPAPTQLHQFTDNDAYLRFVRSVPAGGSARIVQVFSTAPTLAEVEQLAAGVRARLAEPIQTPPGSTPVPAPGAPGPAAPSTRDLTPPRVGGLRVTPRRFRVGTRARVSWRVSEAGRTTLVFERKRGKRFVAAGQIVRDGATGARSLTLGRKVGRRTLVPGSYRLRVRAADRAGNVTPRSTDVRFTVLRRRR